MIAWPYSPIFTVEGVGDSESIITSITTSYPEDAQQRSPIRTPWYRLFVGLAKARATPQLGWATRGL